jgi:hypothetical protein
MISKAGCQRVLLIAVAVFVAVLVAVVAAVKYVSWWAGVLVAVLAVFLANVIIRWAVKRAIGRLALLPFTIKSSVLRGAGVEIHRVEKVPKPREGGGRGFVDMDGSRVQAETVETRPHALPPGQDVIDPRAGAADVSGDDRQGGAADGDAREPVVDPVVDPVRADGRPPKTYWRVDATVTPRPGQSQMQHWEPGEMVLVPYRAKTDVEALKADAGIAPVAVEVFENGGWSPDEGGKYVGRVRVRYTFPLPLANEERRWKLRYYFEGLGDVRLEG